MKERIEYRELIGGWWGMIGIWHSTENYKKLDNSSQNKSIYNTSEIATWNNTENTSFNSSKTE